MKHFYLLSLFLLFYNFLDAKKDNPKTQKEKLKHALNEGEKGHPTLCLIRTVQIFIGQLMW